MFVKWMNINSDEKFTRYRNSFLDDSMITFSPAETVAQASCTKHFAIQCESLDDLKVRMSLL